MAINKSINIDSCFVFIYHCWIKHASVCLTKQLLFNNTATQSYQITAQSIKSIVFVNCCIVVHARVSNTSRLFNNCKQFLWTYNWILMMLCIKHAYSTMSLFHHQQDCQHTQINLYSAQLQTNQSIEYSIAFQSKSMVKHFLLKMIVKQSKVIVMEVVLIENRKNSCIIK